MRKQALTFSLLLLFVGALAGRYLHFGYRSSQTSYNECFEIKRPYYPLRHWLWSGIFPFEGGFISDPHFLCSEPLPVPDSAKSALGTDSSFQVVDINPFFNDASSEIELLIRSGKSLHEFALQFPKQKGVQAVLALPDAPVRIFPAKEGLVLLGNFSGPAKGLYVVPLPLRPQPPLTLIRAGDPSFDTIARQLKDFSPDSTLRDQFCESRRWDFISFYEKYAAPCLDTKNSQKPTAAGRFDEFWKRSEGSPSGCGDGGVPHLQQ